MLSLLAAASLSAQSIEAGFPCAKALSAQERLVCANRRLAGADRGLNGAYRDALAQLTPRGRQQLRISQRAWIRFRDAACRIGAAAPASYRPPEQCLDTRYHQRTRELEEAVRRVGPFQVVRLDGYRVWPAPGHSGWYDGILTNEERFDWIDSATGGAANRRAADRWNAGLDARETTRGTRWFLYPRPRREADAGSLYGGETETGRDVEIVAASSDAIVARRMDYWMGGAHPWEEVDHETLLVPERRPLARGDLIAKDEAFARLAHKRLTESYPTVDFTPFRHLHEVALSPLAWEPRPEGLVVHFGTVLGRPSGDLIAKLGWAEAAPLLSRRGRRIAAAFEAEARRNAPS